jgi:hypothetical protein
VLNAAAGQRAPCSAYHLSQVLIALSLMTLLSTGAFDWVARAFFCRGNWNLAWMMTSAQVGQLVDKSELGLAYGITEAVMALTLILGPLAAGFIYARAELVLPDQPGAPGPARNRSVPAR